MAHNLMVLGSMSGVGKSLITAGICRILKEDGHSCAPFKSQNMALNSYVTWDGKEMGRAQVLQACAAGIEPEAAMNPILLKPTGDQTSQVIVMGDPVANMSAAEYYSYKRELIPVIKSAYESLSARFEYMILEGAGSPAEINLNQEDIVNMGMAEMADAPAILAGDIDRGGVFAQLIGTVMLLEEAERQRIKGLVINKFRGDIKILRPGLKMLEERAGIPVIGVIPYLKLNLEEEDSLADRICVKSPPQEKAIIDIAVIRLPRMSNYTDFQCFDGIDGVSVRYVDTPEIFGEPDMVILPGTKNTMGDLKWLKKSGLENVITSYAGKHPVIGICGGYQMLGESVEDPYAYEEGGAMSGLGLLPVRTVLKEKKIRRRVQGTFSRVDGILSSLSGLKVSGYEIHQGETELTDEAESLISIRGLINITQNEGCQLGYTYGTCLHGLFDEGSIIHAVLSSLAEHKGIAVNTGDIPSFDTVRERELSKLSTAMRRNLDMDAIYNMLS